mmetsp:Transcript_32695/g.78141  ORF Transcript_32695/g.78141 Transcript_32695/m.78141 type:complete len:251 (+) Transcript_32695:474-1226(+)
MHLWSLIRLLAANLPPAYPIGCGHAKIDELHLLTTCCICEENVLKREVPVRNTQVMKPPHTNEDLPHDRKHYCLSGCSRPWIPVTPREQIANSCESCRDVRCLIVSENSQQLAGIRIPDGVQIPHQTNIHPGPFRCRGVLLVKLSRAFAYPPVWHPLHCNLLPVLLLHEVHPAVVPNSFLQEGLQDKLLWIPRLNRRGDNFHGLLQNVICHFLANHRFSPSLLCRWRWGSFRLLSGRRHTWRLASPRPLA